MCFNCIDNDFKGAYKMNKKKKYFGFGILLILLVYFVQQISPSFLVTKALMSLKCHLETLNEIFTLNR